MKQKTFFTFQTKKVKISTPVQQQRQLLQSRLKVRDLLQSLLVLPKALKAELEEWRERRELVAEDSVMSNLVEAEEKENISIKIFLF